MARDSTSDDRFVGFIHEDNDFVLGMTRSRSTEATKMQVGSCMISFSEKLALHDYYLAFTFAISEAHSSRDVAQGMFFKVMDDSSGPRDSIYAGSQVTIGPVTLAAKFPNPARRIDEKDAIHAKLVDLSSDIVTKIVNASEDDEKVLLVYSKSARSTVAISVDATECNLAIANCWKQLKTCVDTIATDLYMAGRNLYESVWSCYSKMYKTVVGEGPFRFVRPSPLGLQQQDGSSTLR